jgi:hypothetical protein
MAHVQTNPIDIFAGIAGASLEVERFDLGAGVVAEQTFAHLMAPFMLAFAPAEPGRHHPTPWRAAHGGLAFDMLIQISNPASLESDCPLGQQGALWWIVALIRLRTGPKVIVPAVSNFPFGEGPAREKEVQYWPYEIEPRSLSPETDQSKISELDLAWVRKHWIPSAQLAAKRTEFQTLVEAVDQCMFAKRSSLAVLWLWSALEAMFSTGREELRYRMSTVIAAYLEQAGLGRMSLQKRIAKLYDGRSAAAHGREDKAHATLRDTYDLVKRIVIRMIETNDIPTRDALEARLFGAVPS